jgi:hypothetical protein
MLTTPRAILLGLMLIIGTVAMVMSYGTFSALGQSTQLNRWQIQTSASSGLSA